MTKISITYSIFLEKEDVDEKLFHLHAWRIMRYNQGKSKELVNVLKDVALGKL